MYQLDRFLILVWRTPLNAQLSGATIPSEMEGS
jgi:hypothetical protein